MESFRKYFCDFKLFHWFRVRVLLFTFAVRKLFWVLSLLCLYLWVCRWWKDSWKPCSSWPKPPILRRRDPPEFRSKFLDLRDKNGVARDDCRSSTKENRWRRTTSSTCRCFRSAEYDFRPSERFCCDRWWLRRSLQCVVAPLQWMPEIRLRCQSWKNVEDDLTVI